MAIFKGAQGPGLASSLVLGGFCLLGLILTGIVATIILSLISIYIPNQSQQAYGDAFRINRLGLKSTYTNTSGFSGRNLIAVNKDLSTSCTNALAATGVANIAGCLVNAHSVLQPGLMTNTINRRKRDVNAALISLATANLYFANTCARPSDKNKTIYSNSLSSCVRIRLTACNQLFNSSSGTVSSLSAWPVSNPFAYSILSDDGLSYVFATVTGVAGIQPGTVISRYASSLTQTNINELSAGCQYIGPISQSDIAAILASQNSVSYTTTSYAG